MRASAYDARSPDGRRRSELTPGAWVTAETMASLRPVAAELSRPADGEVPYVRFGTLAVIGASAVLVSSVSQSLAAHAFSALLAIVAMWCLDNFAHEAVHGHVGRPLANRVLGVLASLAVLSCFSAYRAYHLEHHARTATADDPEGRHVLASRRQYALLPLIGLAFWVGQVLIAIGTLVGRAPRYVRTSAQRRAIRVDATVLLGALAVTVVGAVRSPAVRWGWAAPLVAYLAFGQPYFTLYEHFGAEAFGLDADARRYPLNLTRTTETWTTISWLLSYSNLHAAHHAFPQVPGDRLPALDAATRRVAPPELRAAGFVAFHRAVWRSLPWRAPAASPSGTAHGTAPAPDIAAADDTGAASLLRR